MRSFLTIVGLAATVSAKAGPKNAGNDVFSLFAAFTNTGTEPLKLLKDPRGLLSTTPTDKFIVSNGSGRTPNFAGMLVKYSPAYVVSTNDPELFLTIEPGKTVTVAHDLSKAYNFKSAGAGEYTVTARNPVYYYISPNSNEIKSVQATRHEHKLIVPRWHESRSFEPEKRANASTCSESRKAELATAARDARDLAGVAFRYLDSSAFNARTSLRFNTWFASGSNSTVKTHFDKIQDARIENFIFDCSCTSAGTFAYVYPNTYGEVYLCGAFWRAPALGTDSKAGTLVHETSHFTTIAATQDHAYGQKNCKALAQSSPAQAIMNADSHEYFAENTPALA